VKVYTESVDQARCSCEAPFFFENLPSTQSISDTKKRNHHCFYWSTMARLSRSSKADKKTIELVEKRRESITEEESDDELFDLELGRVRFAEAVKRYDVLSLDDYTKREVTKSWYSEEEKDKITAKINKLVTRMDLGKTCKRKTTYRGLECWTEQGSIKLDQCISRTVDAVMDEQDAQWAAGLDNWNQMAKYSRAVSEESKNRALELAEEDAQEARKAYEAGEEETGSDEESTVAMSLKAKEKGKLRRRHSGLKKSSSGEKKKDSKRRKSRKSRST
jgi:hypothetical protein